MKRNLICCGILLFLCSCSDPAQQKQKSIQRYFDIKGYFERESMRLTAAKPLVDKTVMVNDSSETRSLKIRDWKKELASFSEADINKAAWKGLFTVSKAGGREVYASDNDKVPVKELQIIRKNNKITGIKFLIKNTNSLYTSTDTLSYYPDSLYEIRKSQHIRLLNEKNYRITGRFK